MEIRRRVNPGQPHNNEFADWQLAVPIISTKINATEFTVGTRWGKKRCSEPLLSSIPRSYIPREHFDVDATGSFISPRAYTSGVLLDVPGRESSQLLDKTVSSGWPSAAKKVTVEGWYFTCIANVDGAGTEGFYAHAPNGERYRFDVIRSRNAVSRNETWRIVRDKGSPYSGRYHEEDIYYDVLAASEVVDVHGNWVRYHYNSAGRLNYIDSNDGRRIDLHYNADNRIESVVSNPGGTDERQWLYHYSAGSAVVYRPPYALNGTPGTIRNYYGVLSTVIRPDGRQWEFDLAGLYAGAVPGRNDTQYSCRQRAQVITLRHPDGVKGEFKLEEISRLLPHMVSQYGPPCPNATGGAGAGYKSDFFAVVKKTLSAESVGTKVWQYDYQDNGEEWLDDAGINRTITTLPDGSVRVSEYSAIYSTSNTALQKEEIYASSSAATPLQKKEYTWLYDDWAGESPLSGTVPMDTIRSLLQREITITRGYGLYHTRYTYATNRAAADYSYGYPTRIQKWFSVNNGSPGTRTTEISYLKDSDDWILGLTETVTKNGKLFDI